MRLDPQIFKAYDIRGVVPNQLDAEGAEQIGRTFAGHLQPETVVVGRDMRSSGPELHSALLRGLTACGVNVIDIGLVSTDEYYYACATNQASGLMITASHNPPVYNGFKMVRLMPNLVSGKELGEQTVNEYPDAETPGNITATHLHEEFLDYVVGLIDLNALKPLKVVVDSGNGMTGPLWRRLKDRLPVEIIQIFDDLDGSFPNHGPDPYQMENQQKLRERVVAEQAAMGFIFDPDGDRFFLVDDLGRSVAGDYVVALLAEQELAVHPGQAIVYDVRTSDAVPALIEAAGGRAVLSKVGHAHIKPRMAQENAVFGGEASGHIYYKDFFFADSGVLPALKLLEYVSKIDGPISTRLKELEGNYVISGEINSTVHDIRTVIANLKERYKDGETDEIDGISIRYPDWHFNARPSNTEPLIRLNVEAYDRTVMETKRDELLALIREGS